MTPSIYIVKYKITRNRNNAPKDMYNYVFTPTAVSTGMGDYLIRDTLRILDETELNEPYEFATAKADFQVIKNSELDSLFTQSALADVDTQFFLSIEAGSVHFVGYIDKQDLLENSTEEFYTITASNLISYFMQLNDWALPEIGTNTIDYVLNHAFSFFGSPTQYEIDLIHSSQKTINETNYNTCRSNGMSVPEFLKEVAKALICYFDFVSIDGSLRLLLVSRHNQSTAFPTVTLDDLVLDRTEEVEIYKPPKYNRVAVNAEWYIEYNRDEEFVLSGGSLPAVTGTTREEGIAIISPSSTASGSPSVFFKVDLEGYESDSSLLNLVEKTEYSNNQWQYDTGATTVFFRFSDDDGNVPIGNAVNFVKDIIYPQVYINMIVNTLQVFKFQKASYNGSNYRIISVDKDFENETTKIRLQKIL